MIEEDLVSHLSTEVATLIGERVYPLVMPQDCVKPALVYTVVNDLDNQGINGGSTGFSMRIQIDCYAESYTKAKELKNAVKIALYSFEHYPHDLNNRDIYEETTKLHRQLIDFKLKG